MCNRDTFYLSEIANIQTGPFGSQLHKEDYVQSGTPIITVEHLGNRLFTKQNLPCVSASDKSRLKKYLLATGDIIFSRVGSVDRCSFVNVEHDGWLFSGRCLRIRPDVKQVHPSFLYYYLTLESIKQFVRNIAVGATMPSVNTSLLGKIQIFLPPLPEQIAIAETLSCLDDKIELNNRINKNLEAQAQAIFKSWFIDFEPFQDGEFVDSELGKIPKGWRVGTLGELIQNTITGDWGKDTEQTIFIEKVVCIRGADLPEIEKGSKGNAPTRFITRKNLDIKKLNEDEIVIEISGGSPTQSTGRCAYISRELLSSYGLPILCTNFCRALKSKNVNYSPFIYFILKHFYKNSVFFQYENGTTGIKNLDLNSFLITEKVVIPKCNVAIEFKEMFIKLFFAICRNTVQSQTLSTIRDNLLPKLMSGEIQILLGRINESK